MMCPPTLPITPVIGHIGIAGVVQPVTDWKLEETGADPTREHRIWLKGDFEKHCHKIIDWLFEHPTQPLLLLIDSGGGPISIGFALGCLLERHGAHVRCLAVAQCHSSALTVFAGCHERFVLPATTIIDHSSLNTAQELPTKTFVAKATDAERIDDDVRAFLSRRLSQTPEWWAEIECGQRYFSPQEAIEMGWAKWWPERR